MGRGLERPGTNRAARVISFYDCRGRLYARPQCDRNTIRDGGTIGNCIAEFCASDTDCALRMRHFQNQCSTTRRKARQVERERWSASRQEAANREWRQPYMTGSLPAITTELPRLRVAPTALIAG